MRELFRKFQLVATLALGSAPVAVLIFVLWAPELLSWAWVYPVAYGVFCVLSAWIRAKARLIYGIVVSVAAIVLSLLLADHYAWLPILLTDVCYLSLFLWSLTIFGWPPNAELPDLIRLICGALHLIAQFVVYMDQAESRFLLTAQAPGLHAAFVGFLLLLPFSMNRVSINKASTKTRPIPDGMRRKNTWMTAALVALAGLASFVPYIYDWLKAAILWIVRMLLKLLLQSRPTEPQATQGTTPAETAGEVVPVIEETSPLSEIFEAILLVFGILVTVGICVLFVVLVLRRLKKWIGDVWARLEQYAAAVAEDYEDEVTDIRAETQGERINSKRRNALWRKEPVPSQPGENIRYRYRRLLRKHPQWTANTTARENIPPELAKLYEKARYSDHPITQSEAESFRTGTKEL